MWTPEIVRARFVEAVATERYWRGVQIGGATGFWPIFSPTKDDIDGYDELAKADHLQRWQGLGSAKADAMSRLEECYFDWTLRRIAQKDRRILVWGFARCRAFKLNFSKWCKDETGLKPRTAYDRLHKVWDRLAVDLCNTGVLLREPHEMYLAQEEQNRACGLITERGVEISQPTFPPVPKSVIYEKSRDMIRTEQDAETFAKFLQKHNSKGRREQDRREARLLEQIEAA